ncbi:acyl-CoA dehydrogenase [Rhodobacteraceae bacterium W635]|uniref:acyl-CoA dehydrogenase family protein n=1 Tax=Nioella halotolerans TaxID=2303578 RepID=UPI000E3D2503|nr:acyl-CoA dehydrogenase [Rhodobacteraceae bacterium W635]
MDFEPTGKMQEIQARLTAFMEAHVYPAESTFARHFAKTKTPFRTPDFYEDLKQEARAAGLWNLFRPRAHGGTLTNLEYAPLAEIMGRVWWAPEIFNCNAPDTGNMETLMLYGTEAQKARWLEPLLAGEIRSGFAMTEPDVASSDATNIRTAIRRDGEDYVVTGRKWYTTGGMRDSCAVFIVMGKSDPDNPDRHRQQSMILVPRDAPGVNILRHVTTFGYSDAPFGEAEIEFDEVRVPAENLMLGEGRGFEIAQGRLGPGRIHHCMRLVGAAQRALELVLDRVETRETFGRKLGQHQSVREDIARSWCEIEQARLLTLKAAAKIDCEGAKAARDMISAIKIVAPTMAQTVIDRAIQIHGGAGLTQDTPLAELFNYARQTRLVDGPDQVHMMALGRHLVRAHHEGRG